MTNECKKTLAQKNPQGDFTRNVLTLITGTTIAQGITILMSPILTRMYSPEDFGVFALYVSFISIISVIAAWNFNNQNRLILDLFTIREKQSQENLRGLWKRNIESDVMQFIDYDFSQEVEDINKELINLFAIKMIKKY